MPRCGPAASPCAAACETAAINRLVELAGLRGEVPIAMDQLGKPIVAGGELRRQRADAINLNQ
jgi:hypothetical protein